MNRVLWVVLLVIEFSGASSVLGPGDSDFKNISKLFRIWQLPATWVWMWSLDLICVRWNSNFASSAWLSKMIRPRMYYIFIFSFYSDFFNVMNLYPQKLTLTSPTGGGRTVGIVPSRTKATEFFLMNDYDVEWEHTLVYYCTEILILTCSTSYNTL